MNAFLEFTTALVTVSEHLGLVASQEDIGQFDSEKVKYRGWWTHPEFNSLGHVALETMPLADLLDRSKDIFNLLQRLQKSPLLQMAVNLGLKKDDIKGFQSLKLPRCRRARSLWSRRIWFAKSSCIRLNQNSRRLFHTEGLVLNQFLDLRFDEGISLVEVGCNGNAIFAA